VLADSPASFGGTLAFDARDDVLYAATAMGVYRLTAPDQD
jgi:hypothetical protein